MQIFVDNKELDFQLEKEKTLKEVIDALNSWLSSENYFITGLTVDSRETDPENSDILKSLKVENISDIKLTTANFLELKLSQLDAVQQYFILVINNIDAGSPESLIKVLDDYKNIKPLLKINIDKIYENSKGFIESILENKSDIESSFNDIRVFSENIIIVAETRKNEIISPETELVKLKEQFMKTSEDAGNVSILLQTGKDKEAMNTVIEFVEFLRKFSRILSILDIKKTVPLKKDSIQEFNSMLSELCSAIENSDSVLTGDLLEYEIVPVVENILSGI